ncbi:MAG: hypothetical protein GX126_06705 [Bacteroidales bacterium]|nr:hypothetical protein [Bacteroidales bacterium]
MTGSFCFFQDQDEETKLLFYYSATGRHYVNAIYSNGYFFLPLSELFSLLYLYHEIDRSENIVKGKFYNPEVQWKLDFNSNEAQNGKERLLFSADDVRFGKADIYLKPELYEKVFGLKLKVSMNALSVALEYEGDLPVEERQRRENRHLGIVNRGKDDNEFILAYPRERKLIKAGVLDYNIGMLSGRGSRSFNYLFKGGAEVMGGSLSGGISGTYQRNINSIRAVNTTWEYDFRDNPFITSLRAGQLYSNGIFQRRVTGVALSNEPVVPRRYCNDHVIEGVTDPGSEVELYLNNRLCAFQYADDQGYYIFKFPLNYGSVRTKVQIYKPDGKIVIRHNRIITPGNFLPEGVMSYDIKAGITDDGWSGYDEGRYFYQGYIARGITKNITVKGGAAFFGREARLNYYSSLTARINEQYLVNIYVAPDLQYKTGLAAYYPGGGNWKISYTCFRNESLLNLRLLEDELFAGIFFPYTLPDVKSGFRFSYRYNRFRNGTGNEFNGGVSARLRRLSFRVDYRGRINNCYESKSYADGSAFASLTYSFSGLPSSPLIVRGVMLNAKSVYDPFTRHLNSAGLRISKTFYRQGRFHIDLDYEKSSRSFYLQAGMNINLNLFRISSGFLQMKEGFMSRQTISGSLASLPEGGKISFSNRPRVGRAGVSVLMFVDSNENGKYDKNEVLVPSSAVRLDRSVDMKLSPEGILHIGRLNSYESYNIEIIQSELQDPLLSPLNSKLSFIADPNRYKLIKIPLYRTGVIEGSVALERGEQQYPMSGLRVIIENAGSENKEIIKTFSDGTFYTMGILPGRYIVRIDQNQLDYLDLVCSPDKIEIEVRALADGDFLQDIDFVLLNDHNPITGGSK